MRGIVVRGVLHPAPERDLGLGGVSKSYAAQCALVTTLERIRTTHPDADLTEAEAFVQELVEGSQKEHGVIDPLANRASVIIAQLTDQYYSEHQLDEEM